MHHECEFLSQSVHMSVERLVSHKLSVSALTGFYFFHVLWLFPVRESHYYYFFFYINNIQNEDK